MQLRKQRNIWCGKSNKDLHILPFSTGEQQFNNKIEFLAHPKPKHQDEIFKLKSSIKPPDPIANAQLYYKQNYKRNHTQAHISRPRFAQLEEKELQKPVFIGESDLQLNHGLSQLKHNKSLSSSPNSSKIYFRKLAQDKHQAFSESIQETQLIGLDEFNKDTLDGKVDLEKIKEFKRCLHRKYGNRKNVQKIFSSWDREGKGYISLKNVYEMIQEMGMKINIDEARVLLAASDQDNSGDLCIGEFMHLIYDTQEVKVNLNELLVLNEEQKQLVLSEDTQPILALLKKQNLSIKDQEHKKFITELIQKNSNTLKCHFVNLDTNHSGTIAIEKFLDILHKLNIPESILTKQDALNLTERFVNNIGLKYVDFLNFYNEGKKENEIQILKNQQKQKYQLKMYEFNQVQDCRTLDYYQLSKVYKKARQLISTIQRAPQKKEQLMKRIENIQISSKIQQNDLKQIIVDIFGDQIQNINHLLSIFEYSNDGYTECKQIEDILYNEDFDQFQKRVQQKNRNQPNNEIVQTDSNEKQSNFILKDIFQILDDKLFVGKQQYNLFNSLDLDKDGFISHQDMYKYLTNHLILTKQQTQFLLSKIDPSNQGFLGFKQFHSAIWANINNQDHQGIIIVSSPLLPHQSQNQKLIDFFKTQNKKSSDSTPQFQLQSLRPKTRFGATPEHKDTFQNFYGTKQSAFYQDEMSRFDKTDYLRVKFQKQEQTKIEQLKDKKANTLRNHLKKLEETIEKKEEDAITRQAQIISTKGMNKWIYEQNANLRNVWQ